MQGPGSLLNVVTFPVGAGLGRRIVIDGPRGAIFEYDQTNALVASWAAAAGTDPYGHAYAQGLTISAGSIIGSIFQVQGSSSGIFAYDALGHLRLSLVGQDVNDPVHGITCHAGVTTFNAGGAALNYLSTSLGAFFQYRDLGTNVQGILILSVASVAGTEPYAGAAYPLGMFGEDIFGNAIITIGSTIQLFNAVIAAATGGRVSIAAAPAASAINPYLRVDAPEQVSAGHLQMLLQGTSPDGTSPGQALFGQVNGAGGLLTPQTNAMLEVQANVAGGSNPVLQVILLAAGDLYYGGKVTGDTANRLRIDSGGPSNRTRLRFGAGTNQDTSIVNTAAGQLSTDGLAALVGNAAETWHTFAALGFANNFTAGPDAVPSYKLVALDNCMVVQGSITCGVGVAAGQTITTLPVGYRPLNLQNIPARNKTGNVAGTITVGPAGTVAFQIAGAVNGDNIQFNGLIWLDR